MFANILRDMNTNNYENLTEFPKIKGVGIYGPQCRLSLDSSYECNYVAADY